MIAGSGVETDLESLGGVLFDMDGTLVDSERLWTISMDRVAADLGGVIAPETRLAMVGQPIPQSVAMMLDNLGSSRTVEDTTAMLLAITAEIFAADLLWQPGAEELIDATRAAGLKTALVTNSTRSLVEVALGLLGRHRFDATVCGDDVERAKPDPMPYLAAMDRIGLSAAQCLAVEDSPSGTQAAVSAGIAVLVVPSEVPVPEGPGRIFANSLLGATVDELHHIHREFRRSVRRGTA